MENKQEKQETRLTVRVPSDKYKDFKIKCAMNDQTITDVILKAIDQYMKDNE